MNDQWDDSLLVATWDKAYAEYLKYHKHSEPEKAPEPSEATTETNEMRTIKEDNRYEKPAESSTETVDVVDITNESAEPQERLPTPMGPSLEHLDDDMRKLVMSWYWAGYYQGLYEGKK